MLTVLKLFNYYSNKPSFMPRYKEFMKWCGEDINRQQIDGGYIALAKKKHIPVNYSKGCPNQKWHLLYSYCYNYKQMKGNVGELKCPELVIWMSEAAEIVVTDEDIKIMKKFILDNGRIGRNYAGVYLWNKNKEEIIKKVIKYGIK